jgi:subtilisin family serine protease
VPTPALADAVVVPDEMLVAVAASAPESAESNWARRLNLDILERTTLVALGQRIVRCRIPDGRTVASVVAAARRDANERRGIAVDPQPNYLYRPQQDASRPAPSSLQYALAKMDLDRAHHSAIGRGVVVGVIDTGIDLDHADLRNSDILALDATGAAAAAEPHGTAIAGIIAARGTTQGIAPMARILSVRAFAKTTNGTPQLATTFIVLKALDIAVRNEARVLNLSFAGPADPMLGKAIAFASKSGVIMVAAAGNNGRKAPPVYPAAYPSVIAATAVDADDRLYTKANIGKYVTIAAPGVDVLATAPGGAHALHSGTSFAAAHVTGIVALLMEQRPGLSADEVRRALIASATDLGSPGIDDEFGAGRVSAAAALDALKPSAPR